MLKCVWIITHRNRTFYAVGVSISIEIIIQRKISAFFVVVHHLRQKSIISSQKKEANKWVKIHFFCWLMTVRFFCTHFTCAMCQCVSILMQFWMLPFYCSIKYWHFHGITNVCRCGIEQNAFAWIFIFLNFYFRMDFEKKIYMYVIHFIKRK